MLEGRTDEADVLEELRASRFTLVDERGNVRGALAPGEDGSIGLRLLDREERPRIELGVDPSGAANVKLHGPEGEVCAWLAVGRHGDPSLYLHGTSRHRAGVRGHAELSVDEHGSPVLTLHDTAGQARVLLALDERTGTATLSCADAHGNSCVLLGEDDGGGHVHLFGRDDRPREVPTLPLGAPPPARRTVPRSDAGVAALAERLGRLERTSRRRGRTSVVALVLLGGLLGAAAAQLARPASRPSEPIASPRIGPVVHAEELILEDRSGAMRARLSVLPDGTPLLWMTDPGSASTAVLSVLPDSGAQLRLTGGKASIALSAPPADPPSLAAYAGSEVLFQAPSHVARFLPLDLSP